MKQALSFGSSAVAAPTLPMLSDVTTTCQGSLSTHRQSPHLCFFTSAPEARALPSAGVTRLHRYLWPSPTSGLAAVVPTALESLPPPIPGLPQLPRSPSLYMPRPLPRRTGPVLIGFFPDRAAVPVEQRVGVRIFTFEACSGFTRVAACKVARPPKVDLVTRLRSARLPGRIAVKLQRHTDNSFGGSFPRW